MMFLEQGQLDDAARLGSRPAPDREQRGFVDQHSPERLQLHFYVMQLRLVGDAHAAPHHDGRLRLGVPGGFE
jgi:hypothetical protein